MKGLSMAKFKRGDRVRVVRCVATLRKFNGAEGKITQVDRSNRTPYHVTFTEPVQEVAGGVPIDWADHWFLARELDAI
jgi:hypothetical protein